jgi:hypothetical protein
MRPMKGRLGSAEGAEGGAGAETSAKKKRELSGMQRTARLQTEEPAKDTQQVDTEKEDVVRELIKYSNNQDDEAKRKYA